MEGFLDSAMLAKIAGSLSLLAHSWYILSILVGNTKPSKSGWWILTMVWSVILMSSIDLAPGDSLAEKFQNCAGGWISLVYLCGALIIAILSITNGEQGWSWGALDWLCAMGASVAVLFYVFYREYALYALIISLVADAFGIIPTIKNGWKNPYQESIWAWGIEVTASVFAVFAITRWTMDADGIGDWSSPMYLLVGNGLIFLAVILGRIRNYKKVSLSS